MGEFGTDESAEETKVCPFGAGPIALSLEFGGLESAGGGDEERSLPSGGETAALDKSPVGDLQKSHRGNPWTGDDQGGSRPPGE